MLLFLGLQGAYAQVEGDTLTKVAGDTLTVEEIDDLLSDDVPVKEVESPIMMKFVRYKASQSPDSLYFNILKIKNNTDKRLTGTVNINVPEEWKLISPAKNRVRIASGKSTYIPVRVVLSRNARGGVAYVINASMIYKQSVQNQNSEQLLRTDCYVSIPRISDWKMSLPKRVIYFSKQVEFEKFDLYLENRGNSVELIRLDFTIGKSLKMYGAAEGHYSTTVSMPTNSDTVISFSIKHILQEDDLRIHNWRESVVNIKASAEEKSIKTTVWFKYFESSFTNDKNERHTPLNLEVTAHNLLSNFRPLLNVGVYGTILLRKNRDIDYNFRSPNLSFYAGQSSSDYFENLWRQSWMRVEYSALNERGNGLKIALGDVGAGMDQVVYGRGISGSYTINNNEITAAVTRHVYLPINGVSIQHSLRLKNGVNVRSGLAYENDDYNKINSASGALGTAFSLFKTHGLNLLFSISNIKHNFDSLFTSTDTVQTDDPDTTLNGFGYQIDYRAKINKFRITINNRYGSKHHSGVYKGRFEMIGSILYSITPKHYVTFRYSRYDFNPAIYLQGHLLPKNKFRLEFYDLHFSGRVNSKISLSAGPAVEFFSQERFNTFNDTLAPFSTLSERLSLRLNYRNGRYNTFTPYVLLGYTKTIDSPQELGFGEIAQRPYYNARAGVNLRRRYWGVNILYYYGPYTIHTQNNFFISGSFNKTIRILPFYEKYFPNRKIKLTSYSSYMFDGTTNSQRVNLHARVEFFLNKGWTLHINNNIFFYSRYDEESGQFSQRTYYFDIGFKKAFDIPQPRIKYYDLKVVFYKDLNGNRAKDKNEGGLDNILVKIEGDELADTVGKALGKFTFIELVSDQFGEINYYNIPEGNYKITILPLRSIKDLYNINGTEQRIIIKNNTTHYVPFVQANKVTGRIVLIRDEYSSEGGISIADVRITAIDSARNTYSTLTDRQGRFALFVPQTGRTKVRVNNVFGENFKILQDEFTVDFNGFREFEIVFKFKEKARGINIRGGDLPPGKAFKDRKVNGFEEGSLQPGVPDETPAEPVITEPPPRLAPVPSTREELTPKLTKPTAPPITWEETNNYIVLASFNNRANAQEFLDNLTPKDNALIVTTPKGMYRVVYGYRSETEAKKDLAERKTVFPAAWISKKAKSSTQAETQKPPAPGRISPKPGKATVVKPARAIQWEEVGPYIVIGSFKDQANARKYFDKLPPMDNALIIKAPEGMYRVILGYRTDIEAVEELKSRQSIFPSAWMSKKK